MEKKKLSGDAVFRLVFALVVGMFIATVFGVGACSEANKPKASKAAFYAESFFLECVSGAETVPMHGLAYRDPLRMAFTSIEYVKEMPPVGRRAMGVVYIGPGRPSNPGATDRAVDRLNEIIVGAPGINVPGSLTLPLTTDQVMSEPDAVMEIIVQLDAGQWRKFYFVFYSPEAGWPDGSTYAPEFVRLARDAGIEPPEV